MEADSEHLGAWCACPEQGALPGWIPGIFQHGPAPAALGGRAAVPAGRRQRAGKNVAPHGGAVTGPDQPPRRCLAWLAMVTNPPVSPPLCTVAPVRYHSGVLQPPLTAGAPELARPQGRRGRTTGPGDSARHAGSCSLTGSGFAPQHRAWPMGGGSRQEGGAPLVRRIPTALSRRVGGPKGHYQVDMEGKAFTTRSRLPLLPSGCEMGALSFEFSTPNALQMERLGRGRRPPSRPGGLHGRSCSVRALRAPALLALRSAPAIGCG